VSFSGNTGSIASSATAAVLPESTKEALQGTVSINGTAKVGETLTANTSGLTNKSGTATYQWQANGQNIAGATGSTYTLTASENGDIITVIVSYSGNTGNITSGATSAVLPSDPTKEALQGTVSINGTAKVGETLSANTSGLTNASGNATYQWQADGQNIAGATSSTYTLTASENGEVITVVVSYSGNTGSITSAATTAVQPENTGGVYAVLADKFPVFQDVGVSDAEMANAYANLTVAYSDLVANLRPYALDGKIIEIHILPSIYSTFYTWDTNTKTLGVKEEASFSYWSTMLNMIFDGSLPPTVSQGINHAEETVRMVMVPQQDGADSEGRLGRAISQAVDAAIAQGIKLSDLVIYVDRQNGQRS
jgi:hypothetical protein